MTERSSITITEKSSSRPVTSGSAAKAARHAGRGSAGARGDAVSAEERERLIAMAAYYRAEHRGFAPGGEFEDWCQAAAEIDRRLGSIKMK